MDQQAAQVKTARLPMLALRGLVVYPNMVLHFDVGRKKSVLALNEAMGNNQLVFLVTQKDIREDEPKDYDLYSVGVVAEVRQILKMPGDSLRVLVEGLYRAKLVDILQEDPFMSAMVEELPLKTIRTKNQKDTAEALMRTVKDLFEEYSYLTPQMPKDYMLNVMASEDPVYLCEYISGNLMLKTGDKQRILEESAPIRRLELLVQILEDENSVLSIEKDLYDKVKQQVDKNQREYFLREQMKVISSELGEGDSVQEEAMEYFDRIERLHLPKEAAEKLTKEAERLFKMPYNSQEASVIRNYLDTCLDLPWNKETKDKIDIAKAKRILDRDHYGLSKVKERILELLAVRKLAPDITGQIICLVGPPGVGKTSIARSVAAALGRKYARISLGGVRDESDIRGHRKTYVGAMPGRIIDALSRAGSKNALILLDEVDKLSHDFRGDPASALLEVLDSEQNKAFRDHYIELAFDISNILFITTANDKSEIPAPLLDRMELIELSSYTREEKFHIARNHLAPKQVKRNGLSAKSIKIADSALYSVIDYYTREAGVRKLERAVSSLCRKTAKLIVEGSQTKVVISEANIGEFLGPRKFRPDDILKKNEIGVVTGLAWTSVGGEIMMIEVNVVKGTGKIQLTGSLGDVMKESANIAVSYIRSKADKLKIDEDFYKDRDIHIHAPEGAVPKDGPSAGVTMVTALVSALTGIPVKREVAMTGEVTLRGRVLPIGGLKEKTMAAYRAGVKTVIIPEDNRADLEEIDETVRQALTFVLADDVDNVLKTALLFCTDECVDARLKDAVVHNGVELSKKITGSIDPTIIPQ